MLDLMLNGVCLLSGNADSNSVFSSFVVRIGPKQENPLFFKLLYYDFCRKSSKLCSLYVCGLISVV